MFSPDGRFLAIVGSTTLWLFSVTADGSLVQVPRPPFAFGDSDTPNAVAFSSNDRFIAGVNTATGRLVLYSLSDGGVLSQRPVSSISVPAREIQDLAFSPSGDFIAAPYYGPVGGPNAVLVISVGPTGRLARVPGGPFATEPGGWPVAVAYSPDGKYLAAADSTGDNVVLFAVGGDGALARIALLDTGNGGSAGISGPDDVAFSPNGRLLAAANFQAGTVATFAER